jgi:CubicO group peptidase (beta-lactamase class C family)
VADVGEWRVDAPHSHGLDADLLDEARDYAFAAGRNTQGVVIVHEGAIVAEWYAAAADADSWAASWSMAKSVTSAAIGIALDEGLIPSVDEPMSTWYPEFATTARSDITLRDVLQMGSGLAWVEDYSLDAIGDSDIIQIVIDERDQLAYAASRPAEVEPGTRWSYSSGDTQLLSGVLAQATGMPADEYAEETLFDPLGMSQVEWWRDAAGHTLTYCCLDTTSRDFARVGQLYLQGGVWGDEQVVPADWVEESWQPSEASEAIDEPYGYQWWLADPEGLDVDLTSAAGHDGQWIHVIPELDLVVVRNGTYVKDPRPPVADPTLFPLYPSDGLVEGKGTSPPDDWDTAAFLAPIVEAARAGD